MAGIVGVLIHIFVFSRGERDRHAPTVVKASVILGTSTFLAFWSVLGLSFHASLKETTVNGLALLIGLFVSMGTYRFFFHPLSSFPGPVPAKVTAWWIFKENYPDLRFYIKLRDLHDKYGDFVRISGHEHSRQHAKGD